MPGYEIAHNSRKPKENLAVECNIPDFPVISVYLRLMFIRVYMLRVLHFIPDFSVISVYLRLMFIHTH